MIKNIKLHIDVLEFDKVEILKLDIYRLPLRYAFYDDSMYYSPIYKKLIKRKIYKEVYVKESIMKDVVMSEIMILKKIKALDNQSHFLDYIGVFRKKDNINDIYIEYETGMMTLKDVINQGKVFTIEETVDFLKEMTDKLIYMESNGIVHRNIKPKNIVMVRNNRNFNAFDFLLTDFSKGAVLKKNEKLLEKNTILTKKNYKNEFLAPELSEEFDDFYNPYKSDIYSLGKICLSMLSNMNSEAMFSSIIEAMLDPKPENRLNFEELKIRLKTLKKKKYLQFSIFYWQSLKAISLTYISHLILYKAYVSERNMLNEARFHIEKAYTIYKKGLENEKDELIILRYMGHIYRKIGLYMKSFHCLRKTYQLVQFRKEWVEERAMIMDEIGYLFKEMCEYKNSAKAFKEGLDLRLKIFGENSIEVLNSYQNLTNLYNILEDKKLEEEFFQNSIKILNKFEKTAEILLLTANLHRNKGKLNEAIDLYKQASEKYEVINDELNMATCEIGLARIYKEMRKYDKALEEYYYVLEIYGEKYGNKNWETTKIYDFLGGIEQEQGNMIEAEDFFKRAYRNRENCILFENEEDAIISNEAVFIENLEITSLLDNITEEIDDKNIDFSEVYHQNQSFLHANHHHITINNDLLAKSFNRLGRLHLLLERYDKAKDYYYKALDIRETLYGYNDPYTAVLYKNIGFL